MKCLIPITIILLATSFNSFAQSKGIKPLAVGDTLPPINLKGFLNDSLKQKELSEFYKDKLLLIDLSATWCAPCIKSWPELDSLKNQFKGKLEILAVTQEKKANVARFFRENAELKNLDFDFITDNISKNPLFYQLFPHKYVPQIIWVNSKGVVIASTDEYKVTKENIEKAIRENFINLPVKKDIMNFNPATYELVDTGSIVRSYLLPFIAGLPSSSGYLPLQNVDDIKGIHKVLLTNMDVKWMYWYAAFHHTISMSNNDRIIWEMPDSARLKYDYLFYDDKNNRHTDGDEWYRNYAFCYEIETNFLKSEKQLMQHVINDLNLGLNLNGRFEKRIVDCWILKSNKSTSTILTTGKEPKVTYEAGIARVLQNQSMSKLTYFLNKYIKSGQVTDETGINQKIDIDLAGLQGDQNSPEMLNHIINKYHLTLVKGKRPLNVFVISKKSN
jgi:thiol-disulfide isomerase/thioredoxin